MQPRFNAISVWLVNVRQNNHFAFYFGTAGGYTSPHQTYHVRATTSGVFQVFTRQLSSRSQVTFWIKHCWYPSW